MNGTALITGASSGIGTCMARILADEGWNLVISGRNVGALENLRDELAPKGASITVLQADLSKDGAAMGINHILCYGVDNGHALQVNALYLIAMILWGGIKRHREAQSCVQSFSA